jgi:hypothetical protein
MQFFRALTLGTAVLITAAARVPRAFDGHPDLSGIWQAMDLEDHAPEPDPFYQLAAIGAPARCTLERPGK